MSEPAMGGLNLLFVGLAAATWLIGYHILQVSHCRRLGKSYWENFGPFRKAYKDFNAREFLILAALGVVTVLFALLSQHC